MNTFVDIHFVSLLSSQLERFTVKRRNPYKANFRCPICGDSQKSSTKTRGWILENEKTNTLQYHCFNCGASQSFRNFLKIYHPVLFNEYIAEKYIDKIKVPASSVNDTVFKTKTIIPTKTIFSGLKKISQLRHDHPAKLYIESRKIPSDQHYRIYYHPKFMGWINSIIPNKFPNITKDEPRLVIPLIDKSGNVFGVSSRGFKATGLRYITIMFQEDQSKIFGLDKVNFNNPYTVVEGALDSMFLKNSIAMVGADTALRGLEEIANATFVYDAEPRNLEICKRMDKLIRAGYRVCIWPSTVKGKDINDMFLAGEKNVQEIIKKNSFKGLEASLKLMEWRKV